MEGEVVEGEAGAGVEDQDGAGDVDIIVIRVTTIATDVVRGVDQHHDKMDQHLDKIIGGRIHRVHLLHLQTGQSGLSGYGIWISDNINILIY